MAVESRMVETVSPRGAGFGVARLRRNPAAYIKETALA
jgi:hypothetical protein